MGTMSLKLELYNGVFLLARTIQVDFSRMYARKEASGRCLLYWVDGVEGAVGMGSPPEASIQVG